MQRDLLDHLNHLIYVAAVAKAKLWQSQANMNVTLNQAARDFGNGAFRLAAIVAAAILIHATHLKMVPHGKNDRGPIFKWIAVYCL